MWTFEIMNNIPHQENDYDCGPFCCMFACCITADKKINFTQDNMPYLRLQMINDIFKINAGE